MKRAGHLPRALLIALITAALLLVSPANGHASDAADVVSRLQQKYDTIATMTAAFTQDAYSKTLKKSLLSEGRVWFKKPGKMKWLYQKPNNDELISNGKTLWAYQRDINQVMKKDADWSAGIATDFLSGIGDLTRHFKVTLESEKGRAYRLALVPKEPQAAIKKIFIEADKTTLIIEKTVVEDVYGNETRVTMRDVRINTPVEDSLFEFVPPKGAAVVKP